MKQRKICSHLHSGRLQHLFTQQFRNSYSTCVFLQGASVPMLMSIKENHWRRPACRHSQGNNKTHLAPPVIPAARELLRSLCTAAGLCLERAGCALHKQVEVLRGQAAAVTPASIRAEGYVMLLHPPVICKCCALLVQGGKVSLASFRHDPIRNTRPSSNTRPSHQEAGASFWESSSTTLLECFLPPLPPPSACQRDVG